MRFYIHLNKLKEIADSIWVSKLRYGLQLYSEVRTTNEQPTSQIMKELQKSQNKLLRALTGKKVSDRIKIEDMLKSLQMISVNQKAAQIKWLPFINNQIKWFITKFLFKLSPTQIIFSSPNPNILTNNQKELNKAKVVVNST
jgi:hypothetical protein